MLTQLVPQVIGNLSARNGQRRRRRNAVFTVVIGHQMTRDCSPPLAGHRKLAQSSALVKSVWKFISPLRTCLCKRNLLVISPCRCMRTRARSGIFSRAFPLRVLVCRRLVQSRRMRITPERTIPWSARKLAGCAEPL